MKKITFVFTILISIAALASGAEEVAAEHEGIPYKDIGLQALNLGILLVALFFLTKDSIKQHFINRRQEFITKSEKTKSALLQAELALTGVKTKLNLLESNEKSALSNASVEANLVKINLIKDAEAQAIKLKEDSKMTLNAELEKARKEIGETILGEAIAATTRKISDQKSQITKDSESEFLRQIKQVKA